MGNPMVSEVISEAATNLLNKEVDLIALMIEPLRLKPDQETVSGNFGSGQRFALAC
jgi:hypothetical protein